MARQAYTTYFIPVEHAVAINVAFAIVNGDDPTVSLAMSRDANSSGSWDDPATHKYGGMPSTEAWESTISNLATNMPAPAGGWPVLGVGAVSVSEADAIAAAEALYIKITVTQDGSWPDAQKTLSDALLSLGLKKREEPLE